jgi:hypothetical protein
MSSGTYAQGTVLQESIFADAGRQSRAELAVPACDDQELPLIAGKNKYFMWTHFYARNGILTYALSTLPTIAVKPFPSPWQEIKSAD